MGKRKLRACASCGGRHGPPTGKGCTHAEEVFVEKNEEMLGATGGQAGASSEAAPQPDSSFTGLTNQENGDWTFPDLPESEGGAAGLSRDEPKFNFVGTSTKKSSPIESNVDRQPPAPRPAGQEWAEVDRRSPASAAMADWEPEFQSRRHIGLSTGERIVSDRMMRLENSMSGLAAQQQKQIDKIMELFTASMATRESARVVPQAAAAAEAVVKPEAADSDSDSDEEEWKDYFGAEVWKKEKDRIRKNPFDHRNYGKKGEVVESFEQLMVVLFKTMAQFMELKYDVRGIIKHGLMLSEKAAKDVYRPEAFVQYDESVRSRAGHSGPSAFGTVDQEDVLRFFSCDNLKHRRTSVATGKNSHSKKDKFCLRFNDGGCANKNCPYAHKCMACEEFGHSKKDCRNVSTKKKDPK